MHRCQRGAVRGGDAEAHAAVLPRQGAVLRGVPDHRAGPEGELELPPEAGVRGRHTGFRDGARVRAGSRALAGETDPPLPAARGRDGGDYEFQVGISIFGSRGVQERNQREQPGHGQVDVRPEEPVATGGASASAAGASVRTVVRGGEDSGIHEGGKEPIRERYDDGTTGTQSTTRGTRAAKQGLPRVKLKAGLKAK